MRPSLRSSSVSGCRSGAPSRAQRNTIAVGASADMRKGRSMSALWQARACGRRVGPCRARGAGDPSSSTQRWGPRCARGKGHTAPPAACRLQLPWLGPQWHRGSFCNKGSTTVSRETDGFVPRAAAQSSCSWKYRAGTPPMQVHTTSAKLEAFSAACSSCSCGISSSRAVAWAAR